MNGESVAIVITVYVAAADTRANCVIAR